MKNDRKWNLLINGCLFAALAASLAPQYFKAALPWSGYVALAAGVLAVGSYLVSECFLLENSRTEQSILRNASVVENERKSQLEDIELEIKGYLEPIAKRNVVVWNRDIAAKYWANILEVEKSVSKEPESERLHKIREIIFPDSSEDGDLILKIGIVTVEIERGENAVKVFSAHKGASYEIDDQKNVLDELVRMAPTSNFSIH